MSLIVQLKKALEPHSEAERAQSQQAYLKGKFSFLGVSKPIQQKVCKQVFQSIPFQSLEETVLELWGCKEREFHYAALDFALLHRDQWERRHLELFEKLVRTHSWWDTVDTIAVHLMGPLLAQHPDLIAVTDRWIADPNFWIRRTALLFQLRWKEKTDEKRLFAFCLKLAGEKEFFIRKAIGWALREYGKTAPHAIKKFLEEKGSFLSPLSYREASRLIDYLEQMF